MFVYIANGSKLINIFIIMMMLLMTTLCGYAVYQKIELKKVKNVFDRTLITKLLLMDCLFVCLLIMITILVGIVKVEYIPVIKVKYESFFEDVAKVDKKLLFEKGFEMVKKYGKQIWGKIF